jgi:hypothetical protein
MKSVIRITGKRSYLKNKKKHYMTLFTVFVWAFHNTYYFRIIKFIKSRVWAEHVVRMGEERMGRTGIHIGYWWESLKERDHYEDQDVGGWIILIGSEKNSIGWYELDLSGSG